MGLGPSSLRCVLSVRKMILQKLAACSSIVSRSAETDQYGGPEVTETATAAAALRRMGTTRDRCSWHLIDTAPLPRAPDNAKRCSATAASINSFSYVESNYLWLRLETRGIFFPFPRTKVPLIVLNSRDKSQSASCCIMLLTVLIFNEKLIRGKISSKMFKRL